MKFVLAMVLAVTAAAVVQAQILSNVLHTSKIIVRKSEQIAKQSVNNVFDIVAAPAKSLLTRASAPNPPTDSENETVIEDYKPFQSRPAELKDNEESKMDVVKKSVVTGSTHEKVHRRPAVDIAQPANENIKTELPTKLKNISELQDIAVKEVPTTFSKIQKILKTNSEVKDENKIIKTEEQTELKNESGIQDIEVTELPTAFSDMQELLTANGEVKDKNKIIKTEEQTELKNKSGIQDIEVTEFPTTFSDMQELLTANGEVKDENKIIKTGEKTKLKNKSTLQYRTTEIPTTVNELHDILITSSGIRSNLSMEGRSILGVTPTCPKGERLNYGNICTKVFT